MADRSPRRHQHPPFVDLDLTSGIAFVFSWLLVTAIGLLPLYDRFQQQEPAISMPAMVVFFTAVASGVILKRHYSWVGLVMHIFGQIMIWLSLFCVSLALVLYLRG